jgi:hypothetical protein
MDVAVGAAGAAVVLIDAHLMASRAEPLLDQLWIGVGAKDSVG